MSVPPPGVRALPPLPQDGLGVAVAAATAATAVAAAVAAAAVAAIGSTSAILPAHLGELVGPEVLPVLPPYDLAVREVAPEEDGSLGLGQEVLGSAERV